MNKRLYIFLILNLLLYGCSWVNDDLSDCPDPAYSLNLYFGFTGGEASDIDPQDVDQLTIYVFDSYGYFVTVYTDESPDLTQPDYHISLLMEQEDQYQIVAWGNIRQEFGYTAAPVTGNTIIDELTVSLETNPDRQVDSDISHLFYGSIEQSATQTRSVNELIELVQNTYTIHVTAKGLPVSSQEYGIQLINEYDSYSFRNIPGSSGQVFYNRICEWDNNNQLYGQVRTVGLQTDSPATLSFIRTTTNEILFNSPLIPLIEEANRQGASLDFTTTHHFYIELEFDPVTLAVAVSINGWKAKEEEHELQGSYTSIHAKQPLP